MSPPGKHGRRFAIQCEGSSTSIILHTLSLQIRIANLGYVYYLLQLFDHRSRLHLLAHRVFGRRSRLPLLFLLLAYFDRTTAGRFRSSVLQASVSPLLFFRNHPHGISTLNLQADRNHPPRFESLVADRFYQCSAVLPSGLQSSVFTIFWPSRLSRTSSLRRELLDTNIWTPFHMEECHKNVDVVAPPSPGALVLATPMLLPPMLSLIV